MKILGLSAFHRNSAAALVVDGRAVAATEQERFTRKRGDWSFPSRAIHQCLEHGELTVADLDRVVFYQKPLTRFERTLMSQLRAFPRSAKCFSKEMFTWLGDRLWVRGRIANELGVELSRILFTSGHQAHAAAAYYPAGVDEAAVLVVDGPGEWATTSLWRGRGDSLEVVGEQRFPHSIGLFASALTQYLGFDPERDEGKVEALAAFGEPSRAEDLRQLLTLTPGGGVRLDTSRLRLHYDADLLFGPGLVELLGPARIPGGPLELEGEGRRYCDIAASLQVVLEEALLHLAAHAHEQVGGPNLCVGGVLALNERLMARLLADGPFERLHLEPLAHDAGAALGTALFAASKLGDDVRHAVEVHDLGDGARVVPEELGEARREVQGEDALLDHVAERLDEGGLAGWIEGRLPWSPHGLGRRAILADPRQPEAAAEIDRRVTRREAFLPLRAAVTAEQAAALFELPRGAEAALDLGQLTVPAKQEARDKTPALVHRDGQVRLHIVRPERSPRLHALLERFGRRTGIAALAEADLAARGEPPVRGAYEARQVFERSQLDLLVLEDQLLER